MLSDFVVHLHVQWLGIEFSMPVSGDPDDGRDDPDMVGELAAGGYGGLHGWLLEHVYRHARLYRADELLQRSTGRGLDPTGYLA